MRHIVLFFCVLTMCGAVWLPGPSAHAQSPDFSHVPKAFGTNAVPDYLSADETEDDGAVRLNAGSRLLRYTDPFAAYYGHLPVHPGDYRDAIDRGQFNGHTFSRGPARNVVR